jgi:signal transduction histidine kinase
MQADKSAQYRLSHLHDLIMQASGTLEAEQLLDVLIHNLAPLMEIDYAWLLTIERARVVTHARPPNQAVMGKETIAFLMTDAFCGCIPDLAQHRDKRGAEYFADDVRSIAALEIRRDNHAEGYLVLASRMPDAYSKENVDFLFMLALALRPILRAMRAEDEASLPDAGNDDMRRTLTDMLVHDLRAPLGIIRWNMEQLLDGVVGKLNSEQERFVQASIESSQELLEMADSLLDIDRLESGMLTLDLEECSLAQLVQNIAERMDFVTRQMNLRFAFDFPGNYPDVCIDKQLIRRVLFNLLFNASKYAPEGSVIYIEGGFDADRVWLAVEDEGQGIPEEYLESIFDKYVQAAQLDAARRDSTRHDTTQHDTKCAERVRTIRSKGLGLTFCRLAVLAHGGGIRAENAESRADRPQGGDRTQGGARFTIELKRAPKRG